MALTPISLVNRSAKLASPPVVYNKLATLLNDDNWSADNIGAVINTDPALAARLLKLVNSAYYGFPSKINTISRAITIIGTSELSNLVLATSVIDSFKGIPDSLVNMNEFWQHNLGCAIASIYIAKHCGERATERFFIMGLLHNIGSLVLYLTVPDLAKQALMAVRFDNEDLHKAEQRIIGFDHAEVGRALSQAWQLPAAIGEVIRYYHSPTQAKNFATETAIIHLADIVASVARGRDEKTLALESKVWNIIDLDTKLLPEIVNQVNEQLGSLTSAMMDP